MEGFTCPQCNIGDIVMRTAPGRRMRYRHIPNLELPSNLAIPTCDHCGEMWLDSATTKSIEAAMESAYRTELARKAETSIERLSSLIPQRDLERLLGLSSGWLSKIKNGRDTSAPMAALLMILAEHPFLLDEISRRWTVSDKQEVESMTEPPLVTVSEKTGIPRLALFTTVTQDVDMVDIEVSTDNSQDVWGYLAA
ncbi:hypothetical protein [Corallococcus sp. AB011P]|uniref:hypothetical protein n=1 Tax=Corallococcus sp. AB011P TaxID=2316735 RepID=UPI0011C437F0|nr:hypothetical protein [Corallococcus sp. AB011P]